MKETAEVLSPARRVEKPETERLGIAARREFVIDGDNGLQLTHGHGVGSVESPVAAILAEQGIQ